jgi:hypothetical protein
MDCQPETYITGSDAGPGLNLCEPVLFCQSFEAPARRYSESEVKWCFRGVQTRIHGDAEPSSACLW